MWATLIFGGTAGLFLIWMLSALWHLRWAHRLPSLEALRATPQRQGTIRCSVVIAARDEEARIEPTIRRLLAQREAGIELIVVDDRSTDRTSEILRKLAQEDSRLWVKRVDVLPEGWLGKCHACHVGGSAATGDWILFTDADCWLKPDVLARAVRLAERDGVDHVTLGPGPILESPAARAWHLLFLISPAALITRRASSNFTVDVSPPSHFSYFGLLLLWFIRFDHAFACFNSMGCGGPRYGNSSSRSP